MLSLGKDIIRMIILKCEPFTAIKLLQTCKTIYTCIYQFDYDEIKYAYFFAKRKERFTCALKNLGHSQSDEISTFFAHNDNYLKLIQLNKIPKVTLAKIASASDKYDQRLHLFGKKLHFDVFVRDKNMYRIILDDESEFVATIATLNFMKWFIESGLHQLI